MSFRERVTPSPEFCAMVLSAGFGTRLLPLTEEIPKPLVPIGDTPLLGLSLAALHSAGARRLIVNVHHHADRIERYIDTLDMDVHVSREERILGTAGGIARAQASVRAAPFVIVNGDIVGELPISALLEKANLGLVLAVTSRAVGEGTVGLGDEGQVVRLRGERFGAEVASGDYMGVALLGEQCLNTLPLEGCIIGDWALPHLRAGGRIDTVLGPRSFEDVGTPSDYLAANLNWLKSKPGEQGRSYIGDSAKIDDGVELLSSVVGRGARLSGSGSIKNSVILPFATAQAPLDHVIVTPAGVVISAGHGTGLLS